MSAGRVALCAIAVFVLLGGGVVALAETGHVSRGADLAPKPSERQPAAGVPRTRTVSVAWAPLSLSRDGLSLTIMHAPVSCPVGRGQARVLRERTTVEIAVTQTVRIGHGCFLDAVAPILVVRLGHPLAGRRIVHAPSFDRWPVSGAILTYRGEVRPDGSLPDVILPLVPGVVGLATGDAVALLRSEGFRPIVRSDGAVVTAQDPAPGRVPPDSRGKALFAGSVTLATR